MDDDPVVDPGKTLLILLEVSTRRAITYTDMLANKVMDEGVAALIGHKYVPTKTGSMEPSEEYLRGLAQLESLERDRAAKLAKDCVNMGLSERMVKVVENQAALLFNVIRAVTGQLGLDAEQQAALPAVAERVLRTLPAGSGLLEDREDVL